MNLRMATYVFYEERVESNIVSDSCPCRGTCGEIFQTHIREQTAFRLFRYR